MGRLGAVLRQSWGSLGAVTGRLGAVLGRLGPSWVVLGPSWGHPGPSHGPKRAQEVPRCVQEGSKKAILRSFRRVCSFRFFVVGSSMEMADNEEL